MIEGITKLLTPVDFGPVEETMSQVNGTLQYERIEEEPECPAGDPFADIQSSSFTEDKENMDPNITDGFDMPDFGLPDCSNLADLVVDRRGLYRRRSKLEMLS